MPLPLKRPLSRPAATVSQPPRGARTWTRGLPTCFTGPLSPSGASAADSAPTGALPHCRRSTVVRSATSNSEASLMKSRKPGKASSDGTTPYSCSLPSHRAAFAVS